jgi:hypothetical protein
MSHNPMGLHGLIQGQRYLTLPVAILSLVADITPEKSRPYEHCPLLLRNFNHNWNISTIPVTLPSVTLRDKIFSACRVLTDGQT